MKKILAVLLAAVMILCIGMPAFADDEADMTGWEALEEAPEDTSETRGEIANEIAQTGETPEESGEDPVPEEPAEIHDAVLAAEAPTTDDAQEEELAAPEPDERTAAETLIADAQPEAAEDGAVPDEASLSFSVSVPAAISGLIELDNDELYERYIEMQLYGTGDMMWSDGHRLEGIDARLYELIAQDIPGIADGSRSSTQFNCTTEDWGVTAEELGLEYIYRNDWNPDLTNAIVSKYAVDKEHMGLILSALINDFPYDLYWFDKLKGMEIAFGFLYGYDKGDFFIAVDYTVSMAVSRDYAKAGADYEVDPSHGSVVRTAVSNAQAIVERCTGYSDYDKLLNYRDAIFDYVSYNDAAANNSATPYGDPWQLIWVFDGDDTTTVVCEGYAKAFKYLCDLTKFNGDIQCITVTGDMKTYSGSEAHMWNVVHMDDGRNYLVDVTNCDEGTIGAPDLLFLAGCTGSVSKGYQCKWGTGDYMWAAYVYDADTISCYDEDQLTLAAADYEYIPNDDPDPTPGPLMGDVNGDGKVNAADLLHLMRYLNDEDGFETVDESATDLNGDGRIDLADLIRLLKLLVKPTAAGSGTGTASPKTGTGHGTSLTD